jgi:hypothetical protein
MPADEGGGVSDRRVFATHVTLRELLVRMRPEAPGERARPVPPNAGRAARDCAARRLAELERKE